MNLRLLCVAFLLLLPGVARSAPLGFDVPEQWTVERPISRMRVFQAHVPRAEGDPRDGKVIVYYFGPQAGGGVEANLERWKKQVRRGEDDPEPKRSERRCGPFRATILDQTGTYTPPSFGPRAPKRPPLPGTRIINVILPTPEGTYFVRLVGPKKTVAAHYARFLAFLDSAALGKRLPLPPASRPTSRPSSRPASPPE